MIKSAIMHQWRQLPHGEIYTKEDAEGLVGRASLNRLSGHQAMQLQDEVKEMLGNEGIPIRLSLQRDSTVLVWQPGVVEV